MVKQGDRNTQHKNSQQKIDIKDPLEALIARGTCAFRLDKVTIRRIYELTQLKQTSFSAILRQWVLEGLQREESNDSPKPRWAEKYDLRIQNTELLMLMTLSNAGFAGKKQDRLIRNKIRDHISKYYENNSELYEDKSHYTDKSNKASRRQGRSSFKEMVSQLPAGIKLSTTQKKIYSLLTKEPLHFDLIFEKTGIPAGQLSADITMLEIENLVKRHPGDYYSKR
jgi:DNA-binding transcriptional regulator GbsR (MarR family)